MAKKQKWYVVWKGRKPGVYSSWTECEKQVKGFAGAEYKSFDTEVAAVAAFEGTYADIQERAGSPQPISIAVLGLIEDSYSVDAACSGNPGLLEYRGVHNRTGEVIFQQGPFEDGTNNIGEFLAIVHALALFKQKGIVLPIYSDSSVAIGWVKHRKCNTKLIATGKNGKLFELIERAEKWLRDNSYENQIIKWNTEEWGENPADFGRK